MLATGRVGRCICMHVLFVLAVLHEENNTVAPDAKDARCLLAR